MIAEIQPSDAMLFVGALILVLVLLLWWTSRLANALQASTKADVRDLVARIIAAADEDGRTIWIDDDTRRVTYVVLGNQPGERMIWVRYTIKRDTKIAHIECSYRAGSDEHAYAHLIQAAFEDLKIAASVSYSCPEPAHDEMFVYPAPGTENQKQPA